MVNIKFEVGKMEDSAMTDSDAIKPLNTEIMAGKDPDIILLDGLPIKSYIKTGVLENINDIFTSYKSSNTLFSNGEKFFKLENKKFYVALSSFGFGYTTTPNLVDTIVLNTFIAEVKLMEYKIKI